MKKSFLDQIKNIFHSFWRAIIWQKIAEKNNGLISGSFWNFFVLKTSQQEFCKIILLNSVVTSWNGLEKFSASICYKTSKNKFWTNFCLKTSVQDCSLFFDCSFESIVSLYNPVTSCKKLEKVPILIFHKTWKKIFVHFGFCATFGPLLAQKLQHKIFAKNRISASRWTTPDKWTDWRVNHMTLTPWVWNITENVICKIKVLDTSGLKTLIFSKGTPNLPCLSDLHCNLGKWGRVVT